MLNNIFGSIIESEQALASSFSLKTFLILTFSSLVLGGLIALIYKFKTRCSKSFVVTLMLIPAIVQMIIMLVNGNLGTGVAVMGAFSLVRFRSLPGSAKEICSIFLAMAVGLATGMGYIGVAALFVVIIGAVSILYQLLYIRPGADTQRKLRITIPESLDYLAVFDDIFKKYTTEVQLDQVKTASLGSLYKLQYYVKLKDLKKEKDFIDELRIRNGNLEIVCGHPTANAERL